MGLKPALSILLIARDEEARLDAFFAALKNLTLPYEVVMVEQGSRDATAALGRKHGARVVRLPWQGFAATKNKGITLCRAPWILSLDADENPGPELCRSVEAALRHPISEGYETGRLNYFLGKPLRHGGWYPDWQMRLFRRGSARFNDRLVHEGMQLLPGHGGPARLKGDLHHFSYPSLTSYMERLNRYTSLQAQELMLRNGPRPFRAAARMVADPPLTFLKMLGLKAGFLDGAEGWMIAALSASSTFWKYAKWWHSSWKAEGGAAGPPWVLK